jgi:hypothetical protein
MAAGPGTNAADQLSHTGVMGHPFLIGERTARCGSQCRSRADRAGRSLICTQVNHKERAHSLDMRVGSKAPPGREGEPQTRREGTHGAACLSRPA